METTNAILTDLKKMLVEEYQKQLDGFGKMLPAKTKGALLDGFKDGLNTGVTHTCRMLDVTIKD